jgi:hypothetical protein
VVAAYIQSFHRQCPLLWYRDLLKQIVVQVQLHQFQRVQNGWQLAN